VYQTGINVGYISDTILLLACILLDAFRQEERRFKAKKISKSMSGVAEFDIHREFSTKAIVQQTLKVFDRKVETDRQLE